MVMVYKSHDEKRRIQIMEAFHTISESYRQIFLISHEMEIKEMFERVVEL
jgi:DNA repair protein SbcC/Rad50